MQSVLASMTKRMENEPHQRWTVREAVDLYLHQYDMVKKNHAQTDTFRKFTFSETLSRSSRLRLWALL